jgi:hypothetical protein
MLIPFDFPCITLDQSFLTQPFTVSRSEKA